jgi:hypothetical protein
MNKFIKILIIVCSTALVIVAVLITLGFLLFRGMYGNEFIEEFYIPGTKYKAVSFVGNGGALTDYTTGVSLLDTADCLSESDGGNIFNYDGYVLLDITVLNDSCLLIRYQGDSNRVNYIKSVYNDIHIELSTLTPSHDSSNHKDSVRARYNDLKANAGELMSDQEELLRYEGMEFNDKEWGQRIYLDSTNVYARKVNGGFYKVNTSTGIDWNPFSRPKAVVNVHPPLQLVEYNSFLLKHNITKMYWTPEGVCFMKIGETGDWVWFSKNQKDKDFIGKVFTTNIGRKYTGHDSQVYIINPHWKFAVER